MSIKRIRLFILPALVVLSLLSSGCASLHRRTVADVKREAFVRSTSKEAFKRAEPLLLKLKPGDAVNSTGLKWSLRRITQRGNVVGVVASSDGWIAAMSGRYSQTFYKFGSFYGRSGDVAYGKHVFGYVWRKNNLTPQYLLKTQAVIISDHEYEQLYTRKAENIGWTWTPGKKNTKTYLKDIKVMDVQRLDFAAPKIAETRAGGSINVDGYIKNYLTPEKFQEAKQKMKQFSRGMGSMDVVTSLGGFYVMSSTGEDFSLWGMKGFLIITNEYREWHKVDPAGVFMVWGFGYVEGKKEIPKLALIFKNGEVLKVVPYAPREELEKHFSD